MKNVGHKAIGIRPINGIVCLTQLATMFFYPATVHFESCTLNVNKIDVVLCFRKLICAFSLRCFRLRMCKISDKSVTFSLNYSTLFRGPLFSGQCIIMRSVVTDHDGSHDRSYTIVGKSWSHHQSCNQLYDQSQNSRIFANAVALWQIVKERGNWFCVRRFFSHKSCNPITVWSSVTGP